MPLLILALFIAVPIVEIAVLIEVGSAIGLWPTLGLVIATAVFGTWMLRIQGLSTLRRAQASMAHNQFPAREVFAGLCLVFAGALLLTPGLVTDAVGIVLLIPIVRDGLWRRIARWIRESGRFQVYGMDGTADPGRGPEGDDGVIDGDFTEIDPEPPQRLPRDDETRRR